MKIEVSKKYSFHNRGAGLRRSAPLCPKPMLKSEKKYLKGVSNMTREEALLIIRQLEECRGPIRFELELDDLFMFSIQRGCDRIVVYKETGNAVWENELPDEEVNLIYRRYYETLR